NLLVGVLMMASVEALTLGVKEGVPAEVLREIIQASTGANWQLQNAVPGTVMQDQYAPRFALKLLHKDLGIAGDMALRCGAPFLAGGLAHQVYGLLKGLGKGDLDFSAVSTLYQDAANITIATGKPRRER
ncbi:MAG TPA: NAD-binding protein, partial [Symbiobacteriaceae bacterium]|nr:NAD-binding protein [Symbiobacteriaceae bacterium]